MLCKAAPRTASLDESWGQRAAGEMRAMQASRAHAEGRSRDFFYWEVIFFTHISKLQLYKWIRLKLWRKKQTFVALLLAFGRTSSTKPCCALQAPLQGLVLPEPGENEIFCTVICMVLVKLPVPALPPPQEDKPN